MGFGSGLGRGGPYTGIGGGSSAMIEQEAANSGALAGLKWDQWKRHTPLLYDMLVNNNLTHPSPCVHWGHRISDDANLSTQRIYYSERGASPNAIVVATAKLPKERQTSPAQIDKFDEHHTSNNIQVLFKIQTPEGAEVNKIYTCKQNHNTLVTKSDLSELHVWDLSTGGGASYGEHSNQRPQVTLGGHADSVCESNFSLDTSPEKGRPRVLSGDREGVILMWQLDATGATGRGTASGALQPLGEFRGHEHTVEDVCFHPHNDYEFCSVGDDKRLLFWDERQGRDPTTCLPQVAAPLSSPCSLPRVRSPHMLSHTLSRSRFVPRFSRWISFAPGRSLFLACARSKPGRALTRRPGRGSGARATCTAWTGTSKTSNCS